jgi:hypothetical protein
LQRRSYADRSAPQALVGLGKFIALIGKFRILRIWLPDRDICLYACRMTSWSPSDVARAISIAIECGMTFFSIEQPFLAVLKKIAD